jgi:uncharacterized protein (DUF433 family)
VGGGEDGGAGGAIEPRRVASSRSQRYPSFVQAFALPPLPLREDEHAVVRVAGSRVTLDSVVALFDRGATAEEIAQSFPTLGLGDVYAVLSYVIVRRDDVDVYLARRAEEERATEGEAELRSPSADLRARLEARRRDGAA